MKNNNKNTGEYRKDTPDKCITIRTEQISNGWVLTYTYIPKDPSTGYELWEKEACVKKFYPKNPFDKNISVAKSLIDELEDINNGSTKE